MSRGFPSEVLNSGLNAKVLFKKLLSVGIL